MIPCFFLVRDLVRQAGGWIYTGGRALHFVSLGRGLGAVKTVMGHVQLNKVCRCARQVDLSLGCGVCVLFRLGVIQFSRDFGMGVGCIACRSGMGGLIGLGVEDGGVRFVPLAGVTFWGIIVDYVHAIQCVCGWNGGCGSLCDFEWV